MAVSDAKPPVGLTPRQQKWFASVQASLERDTGKTLNEWVAIAKTCPETKDRARATWLKERYGLLQNRAMHVLSVAFPRDVSWDDADKLKAALWTDPQSTAILGALQVAVSTLPDVIMGQRKAFTAFSREFQFASIKPLKGGKVVLGLALTPQDDPRLEAPKNEGWSERLKAKMVLERPDQIDPALLKRAWERS
jgi:Domain of unknown function (DUF4287)/Domain of unknown function (DUF5655)